jgi:hypothetical protein
VHNFWNWMLVIIGGVLAIAEALLGAVTGFDLLLLGVSLATAPVVLKAGSAGRGGGTSDYSPGAPPMRVKPREP